MISATLTKPLRSFNRLVSCSSEPACCSPGIVDLAEAIGPEAAFGLTAALSAARRFTPKLGASPPRRSYAARRIGATLPSRRFFDFRGGLHNPLTGDPPPPHTHSASAGHHLSPAPPSNATRRRDVQRVHTTKSCVSCRGAKSPGITSRNASAWIVVSLRVPAHYQAAPRRRSSARST